MFRKTLMYKSKENFTLTVEDPIHILSKTFFGGLERGFTDIVKYEGGHHIPSRPTK